MKSLVKRAKYVLNGEDGNEMVSTIILISVALVIATALFIFKDKIVKFLQDAGGQVSDLKVQ